jgi:hypothetical protein
MLVHSDVAHLLIELAFNFNDCADGLAFLLTNCGYHVARCADGKNNDTALVDGRSVRTTFFHSRQKYIKTSSGHRLFINTFLSLTCCIHSSPATSL